MCDYICIRKISNPNPEKQQPISEEPKEIIPLKNRELYNTYEEIKILEKARNKSRNYRDLLFYEETVSINTY